MKINLKNKVIVISGGNGLIGKEVVREINNSGGICINLDIINKTSSDISNIECDITNPSSVDRALQMIIKKYNKIDGLINNAYPRTEDWGNKFEDIKYSSWQKNIDFQLNSYFYLTQQIIKIMIKQKKGSVLNMASIYGMIGPDFSVYENTSMTMPAAYSAIKGGIINFTRYLSSYLGKYNIRSNSISPGGIYNDQNDLFVKNYNKRVPLGRMGLPKDIAPAVVFLMSDLSSYISGQNLAIDGGWTAI